MASSSGSSGGNKSVPRDALVMAAILKEMGIADYEPRVINQMLEFTYRYVTDVIEEAKIYAEHANRKEIQTKDVKLAIQTSVNHSFTSPPPREFLMKVAREKNSQPLPPVPEKYGLRLPPERHCLMAPNYTVKFKKKARPQLAPLAVHQAPKQGTTPTVVTGTPTTIRLITPTLVQGSGGTLPAGTIIVTSMALPTSTASAGTPATGTLVKQTKVSTVTPTTAPTGVFAQKPQQGVKRKREEEEQQTM